MTYHRVCNKSNTTGVTKRGQELFTLPEHLCSTSVFYEVRGVRSLVFCVKFCISLFSLSFLFFILTIVLSVFLQYTASDYPFGIFRIVFNESNSSENNKTETCSKLTYGTGKDDLLDKVFARYFACFRSNVLVLRFFFNGCCLFCFFALGFLRYFLPFILLIFVPGSYI